MKATQQTRLKGQVQRLMTLANNAAGLADRLAATTSGPLYIAADAAYNSASHLRDTVEDLAVVAKVRLN